MPTCRCKMCGGQILYNVTDSVAKCEFCGTEQTIVKTDDLKQLNLFNRANGLRLQNEFDKAQTTYENILIDDPNNAEAHWGICLCRYGIEYVDDKKTNKKVPTCHRTVFNFIFDDLDYLEALKNADVVAKKMYQSEAKVIDKIQKNILAISQKEDPYDIFICYKETDESGKRTKDSVIAQDIYNELNNRGYKVFFSRITLESKLGSDYEPIIFAALMSSKVMLAIGSKPEYFNAPWVKNEWGRFLSFMKDQHGKYLIPCYFDMEAYDMPEEFLMLQAQDIGKIGYLQDLSRGIDKLFGRTRKTVTIEKKEVTSTQTSNTQIENMIKRVKLSLEDQDWQKANSLLEDILNIDVEYAEAYLYKMLVERKVKNVDELINKNELLDDDKNYNRALRFATDEYREYLVNINKTIKERIDSINNDILYRDVLQYMGSGSYILAINALRSLHDYKDSEKLREECYDVTYSLALKYKDDKRFDDAINTFTAIKEYQDSMNQIEECKEEKKIEAQKNTCIKLCKQLDDTLVKAEKNHDFSGQLLNSYNLNLDTLHSIQLYEEAQEKYEYYCDKRDELLKSIEEYKIQLQEEKERKAKIRHDLIVFWSKIGSIITACLVTIILLTTLLFVPLGKYSEAQKDIKNGYYDSAAEILEDLNFKDSKKQLQLLEARDYLAHGNYESAIDIVYNMGGTTSINYGGSGSVNKDSEIIKKQKYVVNYGEKIGSDFSGWKVSSYEIDYKKHNLDLSLEAVYEPIKYKIAYENIPDDQMGKFPESYYYGDIKKIPNPTKYGYTFEGWIINNSLEIIKNFSIESNQIGNINLAANWSLNGYIITLNPNGGTLNVSNKVAVMYGDNYNLPIPEREGYTFNGYKLDGDFITDEFGKSLNSFLFDDDKSVIADWSINSYRITFTAETGGTVTDGLFISEYNKPITVTAHTAVSYNHTFIGWYLDDKLICENSTLTINTPAKDTNYLAKFTEYKISTSKNNIAAGTITEYSNTTVIAGTTIELIAETAQSSNGVTYAFYGWMCDGYLVEQANKISITMPKRNVEYIAQWVKVEVTSNYDVAQISFSKENLYSPSDEVVISATYPSEYNFAGWYISNNCVSDLKNYIYTTKAFDESITLKLEKNTITVNSDFGNVFLDSKSSYTIKCNCNNGTSVKTYVITYENVGGSIPIPTRNGYVFAGWYSDSALNNKFDFNNILYDDLTLYAKWVQANNSINYIYNYNSESPFTISAINFVQNSANFISLTTGKYKIYYKLSSGNSTDISFINTTTSETLTSFSVSSSQYNYVEIDLVEGNMYSITARSTFNNCYVDLYFNGDKPNFIPNCHFDNFVLGEPMLVAKNTILKLSIGDIPSDKIFGGWYLNDNLVSYNLSIDLTVPEGQSVLTTQFIVNPNLSGFEYELVNNQIVITGIEDKTVTSIIVPNFVRGISKGAFNGCSYLESITLPFIGDKEHKASDANQYPLGYIFGTEAYTNSYSTQQYYTGEDSGTYYQIPISLKEVIITNCSYIQNGAFYGCEKLENIIIPNSVTEIAENAFCGCQELTSIIVPNSVTIIGFGAFNHCTSLETITIPFIGDKLHSKGDSKIYTFGYIFGDGSSNSKESNITQYYWYGGITGSQSANYLIPNSLRTVIITGGDFIQFGSFYNCENLTKVVIPTSIKEIQDQAFTGCDDLYSVFYCGTIDEWRQINISTNGNNVINSYSPSTYAPTYVYFYSENLQPSVIKQWHYVDGVPTSW